MRKLAFALLTFLALTFPATARAQGEGGRPFGLGIMIGAPTGLTAKLYLGRPFAIDMALGAIEGPLGDDGIQFHVELVWHPVILARDPAFTLPLYLGVGARLFHDDDDYRYMGVFIDDDETRLGVRAPLGLLMDFNNVPLDVFLEIALVVDIIEIQDDYDAYDDDDRVDLNAAIGVRYYF